MCGIAGIYNLNLEEKKESQQALIKTMTQTLSHRGPDDEGYFVDQNIALGHRRLSILDLSPAGRQPMLAADQSLVIVFNGEIYNYLEIREELQQKGYRFKTQTDTEVILAAYSQWKEDCVKRFNGMWSLVIYDLKKKQLFASRDRLGVKPFYYFADKNVFIFASEIKALLKHPEIVPRPNDKIIYDYLAHGFTDHSHETFFQDIHQLLPGHNLKITDDKIAIKKFWDLDPQKKTDLSEEQAIVKFKELLRDSINLRLRSDVAVGSCLSGGLDSSSIVLEVNEILKKQGLKSIGTRQKTFSSVYKSPDFQKANEKTFIDEVTKKAKVEAHFIESEPLKLWQDIKKLTYFQDEPFGSTSIYAQWNVFDLARENKVKVMLDGQGADEMMAGYLGTFGTYLVELCRQRNFKTALNEYRAFRAKHPEVKATTILRNFIFTLTQSWPIFNFIFKISRRQDLNWLSQPFRLKYEHSFRLPRHYRDLFKDFNYWSVKSVSLPSLLHWEDRNSMAHSIESRVPFLDYRLVEFIFSLPNNLLIRSGQTKYVLRQAMKNILPEKIYKRQDKIGFATPEEIWFKKYAKKEVESIINSESFKNRPYFNYLKLKEHFNLVMSGQKKFDFTIWRWLNLELWLREFIDQ